MNEVKKPQVQYTAINIKGVLNEFAPAYVESIESVFNQLQFLTAKMGGNISDCRIHAVVSITIIGSN